MNISQLNIFLKDGEWISSPEDDTYFSSSDVAFRFNMPKFNPFPLDEIKNTENFYETREVRKRLKHLENENWSTSEVTFYYNNFKIVKVKLYKVVGKSHEMELKEVQLIFGEMDKEKKLEYKFMESLIRFLNKEDELKLLKDGEIYFPLIQHSNWNETN